MKYFRAVSWLSVFLVLTFWCLPVLAEFVPERCCCCIKTQCCGGCAEKAQAPKKPPCHEEDIPKESACDCTLKSSAVNKTFFLITKNIDRKHYYTPVQTALENKNVTPLYTISAFFENNSQYLHTALFLLKSSFLL